MISIAQRKRMAEVILRSGNEDLLKIVNDLLSSKKNSKSEAKFLKGYNQEIDEAVERIKNGKFYTQEKVDLLLEEWERKK
jgi:hypothetical protein